MGSDKFADMLVAKFTKRISLPISACMELLSGNLLMKRSASIVYEFSDPS